MGNKYEILITESFAKEVKELNAIYCTPMSQNIRNLRMDLLSNPTGSVPQIRAYRSCLVDDFLPNPTMGIELGYGLRRIKMRMHVKGSKGVYYTRLLNVILLVDNNTIVLLHIHDKDLRDNITPNDIAYLFE